MNLVFRPKEFRWALHSGGRTGDDTIDAAAALSVGSPRELANLTAIAREIGVKSNPRVGQSWTLNPDSSILSLFLLSLIKVCLDFVDEC